MNKLKPVLLPFGKKIHQTKRGQAITSDTKFIVDNVLNLFPENHKTLLELGSGNGIISIMLRHYRPNWQIKGIDIQSQLVELANNNALLTESKAKFQVADIRTYNSPNGYQLIVANPPYYPANEGRISPYEERAISRHELCCNMMDVLQCVKRNLLEQAFLLYPGSRLFELEKNVKKVDLKVAAKFILNADFSTDKEASALNKKEKILVELIHA